MDLTNFIIVLPCAAALVIGFLIKHAIPAIPNRFIPLICAVIGLGVNIWVNLSFSPEILVTGLVSGAAATGMFEMVRHLIGESEDTENAEKSK